MLSSKPYQSLLIPHQNSGSTPVICIASASSTPTILTHGLCLNPAKPVPLSHNSSSTPLDLPGLTQINFLWLSSQVPSVWNTSECPVLSPHGQQNLTGYCIPQPHLYQDAVDDYCQEVENFNAFAPYTFSLHRLNILPMQVNNLSKTELMGKTPALAECAGYKRAMVDTAEWLHYGELAIFTHLLQQPAEMVKASLAAVKEPSSGSPSLSAAPTEARPSLSVVVTAYHNSLPDLWTSFQATLLLWNLHQHPLNSPPPLFTHGAHPS
ncbi:hypothetical protein E4T56_gene13271 [Termitomyces sp. T112]|nr:hypothetical protein E4T56_gene13271 [Termitomyces sp. T112]